MVSEPAARWHMLVSWEYEMIYFVEKYQVEYLRVTYGDISMLRTV